jgi:AcrR family transcriptional regulator
MANRHSLSSEDWIKAAFQALTTAGAQAIRAERLARSMGVSKGSFYWHFADVPALYAAMLARWEDLATEQIIVATDSSGGDARLRLTRLMDMATSDRSEAYGGLATEAAIRDWARHDPAAAVVLKRIDARRQDYVARLFNEAGQDPAAAARAARLLYAALVGTEHLLQGPRSQVRQDLQHLLKMLLQPDLPAIPGLDI